MTHAAKLTAHEMSMIAEAFRLANLLVAQMLDDMQAATLDGARWRDTRMALDPREHAGEVIDMVACAVSWGEDTGLIARHPQHRYLVRLTRKVLA